MVTINDVAKAAGVSVSTVTHALNGKRPVSKENKEKILKVIEELGYIPSYSASHLRKGRSGIVGFFAVDITEDFSSKILKGAEKGLSEDDFSMLIASGEEFGSDYVKARKYFQRYGVEGLVVCHHLSVDATALAEFSKTGLPVVFINNHVPKEVSVLPDNHYAGRIAAEHLLAQGVTHPAFIGGPKDRLSTKYRYEGYKQAIVEQGAKLPTGCVLYGDYTYQSGYTLAEKLFSLHPDVDGIFCANDYLAAGAMTYAESIGKLCPRDLKLVGCDNRDFSLFWRTPITTIELPLEEMGITATKLLKEKLEGVEESLEVVRLKPGLITRKSSLTSVN